MVMRSCQVTMWPSQYFCTPTHSLSWLYLFLCNPSLLTSHWGVTLLPWTIRERRHNSKRSSSCRWTLVSGVVLSNTHRPSALLLFLEIRSSFQLSSLIFFKSEWLHSKFLIIYHYWRSTRSWTAVSPGNLEDLHHQTSDCTSWLLFLFFEGLSFRPQTEFRILVWPGPR